MSDIQREALARSISARLLTCSLDELRVLDVVLSRLVLGREEYGPLDLSTDGRNMRHEAAEELTDTLFYLAAHHIAENERRRERLRCELADAQADLVERGLVELRDAEPDLGGES